MFLKSKLGLTILSLYEIAAILLLHHPKTCNAMFGMSFCSDSVLKYFIWCVAVPVLIFLIAMWVMDIIHRIRRRRSLLYKVKHAVQNMASELHDRVSESLSSADMERMMTAALLVGLKRFADSNPRAHQILDEISGRVDISEYMDYEDMPDEYTTYASATRRAPKKQQSKSKKKN